MNTKTKKTNLSNISMKKLKKMIKTEIAIVYVTSKNETFLTLEEAMEKEVEMEKKRLTVKKKRSEIMKVYEILSKVLSKNEWGIFFKGEPIEGFPTQDGMKMYRVNEVASERLFDAVEKEITQMENQCQETKTSSEGEQTENR